MGQIRSYYPVNWKYLKASPQSLYSLMSYIIYFRNQFAYLSRTNSPCILIKTLHPNQAGLPALFPTLHGHSEHRPFSSSFFRHFYHHFRDNWNIKFSGTPLQIEWKKRKSNWFLLYCLSHFAKHLALEKFLFSNYYMLYYVCHFERRKFPQNFTCLFPT